MTHPEMNLYGLGFNFILWRLDTVWFCSFVLKQSCYMNPRLTILLPQPCQWSDLQTCSFTMTQLSPCWMNHNSSLTELSGCPCQVSTYGLGDGSVVEYLTRIHKVLSSSCSITKSTANQQKTEHEDTDLFRARNSDSLALHHLSAIMLMFWLLLSVYFWNQDTGSPQDYFSFIRLSGSL